MISSRFRFVGTVLGVAAIGLWSTVIAVSRSLTEQLGTVTAGAALYLLAGVLGSAPLLASRQGRRRLWGLPATYVAGCGGLFAAYGAFLYGALGFCVARRQVLEVTVINYLWPGLTLVFSVPILKNRPRWAFLGPGIVVCLTGVALAAGVTGRGEVGGGSLLRAYLPHLLALAAAVSWGLYSNLSRRWAAAAEGHVVPLFLLATGLLLSAFRWLHPETAQWSLRTGLELLYGALFPMLLGYVCWDVAMRKGDLPLVAALSYLTPLLSLLVTGVYLRVALRPIHWVAGALVVGGAAACKLGISEQPLPGRTSAPDQAGGRGWREGPR